MISLRLRNWAFVVAAISMSAQLLFFAAGGPVVVYLHQNYGLTGRHGRLFGILTTWSMIGSVYCIAHVSLRPRVHSVVLTVCGALVATFAVLVIFVLLLDWITPSGL
jgi:hypothetical protein